MGLNIHNQAYFKVCLNCYLNGHDLNTSTRKSLMMWKNASIICIFLFNNKIFNLTQDILKKMTLSQINKVSKIYFFHFNCTSPVLVCTCITVGLQLQHFCYCIHGTQSIISTGETVCVSLYIPWEIVCARNKRSSLWFDRYFATLLLLMYQYWWI